MKRSGKDGRRFSVDLRVRITEELNKFLKRLARKRRKSVSQVVRGTIENEMSKEKTNGKH